MPANAKAEMNTDYCSWRLLEKKITDYIRAVEPDSGEFGQISVDDIGECAIYDAENDQQRQDLVVKRVRKVFVD